MNPVPLTWFADIIFDTFSEMDDLHQKINFRKNTYLLG